MSGAVAGAAIDAAADATETAADAMEAAEDAVEAAEDTAETVVEEAAETRSEIACLDEKLDQVSTGLNQRLDRMEALILILSTQPASTAEPEEAMPAEELPIVEPDPPNEPEAGPRASDEAAAAEQPTEESPAPATIRKRHRPRY